MTLKVYKLSGACRAYGAHIGGQCVCDEEWTDPADIARTRLDLTPPRFDVSGNKITGEFDEIKTPELIEVRLEDIEEAPLMPWFLIGVAIGAAAFLAAFVLLTIKGA